PCESSAAFALRNSAYCAFVISYFEIRNTWSTAPQVPTCQQLFASGAGGLPGAPTRTHSMVTADEGIERSERPTNARSEPVRSHMGRVLFRNPPSGGHKAIPLPSVARTTGVRGRRQALQTETSSRAPPLASERCKCGNRRYPARHRPGLGDEPGDAKADEGHLDRRVQVEPARCGGARARAAGLSTPHTACAGGHDRLVQLRHVPGLIVGARRTHPALVGADVRETPEVVTTVRQVPRVDLRRWRRIASDGVARGRRVVVVDPAARVVRGLVPLVLGGEDDPCVRIAHDRVLLDSLRRERVRARLGVAVALA